jgi:hypothetical protein
LASKKEFDERLRRGREQLRQSGVALDDAAAGLLPQLKTRLGAGRDSDIAVVWALGRIADPVAAELLGEIEKNTADKELRKEARRSLFKLAQRGVAVRTDENQKGPEAVTLFHSTPTIEAYMSPPDGGGSTLLWIVKPQANQGLQVIQAMLHDREGLLRIGGTQMRRKELRKLAQDIKAQHGATMIAVPFDFADHELYEGYEKARARGQAGLERFHDLRSLFATGKPKELHHPIHDKLDSAEARAGAWRETSRTLLDEPELRYWIIADPWLQAFVPQLEEAQTSRLVLNPAQKEERFAGIVRDAVKEACRGENGRALGRRMEHLALYLHQTGRTDKARLALAVAAQLGEGDPGPLDVSFLTGLIQKSFAFFLSQQKARQAEEPSLIIKP